MTTAGCSGVSPTQVGQTAGGIAGSFIAPGVGTQLGALVGTLAGMVVEQQVDKVREKKERADLGHQLNTPSDGTQPNTPQPTGTPTRVWVDEQLQRGRLLVGHFEVRNIP